MDKVARLLAQERSELFVETAAKKGITPAIAEKDFWVAWVLNCLFRLYRNSTDASGVPNVSKKKMV